jgi:hypothetical protein
MADAASPEFKDRRRIQLLEELHNVLGGPVNSTAWASLWLADPDCLEALVLRAKSDPFLFQCFLACIAATTQLVPSCKPSKY